MKFYMGKLILENWGPFHEKTSIDFSSDNEGVPVTYILGKNGAGKTMLFNALYWCLFDDPEPKELESIVNKDALKNNEKQMSVRLKFYVLDDYNNRTDYDVLRLLKFDVDYAEDGEATPTMIHREFHANKFTQTSSEPHLIPLKDFGSLMDNLIPSGPRQFFFLDGEKLAELFTIERFQMIESYANAISDINLIDTVIGRLDETYSTLSGKHSKSPRISKEIQTEQRKLDKIKEDKRNSESWEKNLMKQLKEKRSLADSLNKECSDHRDLKPRLERIDKYNLEKEKMTVLRNEKFDEFKKFLNNNLPLLYLEEQLEWCSDKLARLKDEKKIPPKIPSEVIDETLSTSECIICRRKITEEIKTMLIGARDQIPDPKLSMDIQKFWAEIDIKRRDLKNTKSYLETKLTDITSINLEINKIETAISEERKWVPPTLESLDIHAKFKRLNEVTRDIEDSQSQLSRAKNAVMGWSVELKKQQKRLETKFKQDTEMSVIAMKLEFIRETKETMEKVKEQVKRSMIEHVQKYTSTGFKQLVWDPEHWEDVTIADDWTVSVTTSNNFKLPCYRLSAGLRHVLGIAFMSSLGKVTGNLTPFVFDSPFGRISEEPIENIGKNLRPLMEDRQVVLFVTDTEDKNIRQHIESMIGQKYILDKISATESEIRGA